MKEFIISLWNFIKKAFLRDEPRDEERGGAGMSKQEMCDRIAEIIKKVSGDDDDG